MKVSRIMKSLVLPTFAILCWLSFTASGCNTELGKVTGTVNFSGVPCQPGQPDFNVPPCSGAYPNYLVEIYMAGATTGKPVLSMKSGPDGKYNVELPEGNYVIVTQNGPTAKNTKENPFSVKAGETIVVDLSVSTGIL